MDYFVLSPEVAGGLGKNTLMSANEHPPTVRRLNYEFEGWLGDDLLESFPCFIVTEVLALALQKVGLSGYELRDVEVTKSETFKELYPDRSLPNFSWLYVVGTAGRDDFGIDNDSRLVVSEKALRILKLANLNHCEVSEFP